jgi:hypothetical protein
MRETRVPILDCASVALCRRDGRQFWDRNYSPEGLAITANGNQTQNYEHVTKRFFGSDGNLVEKQIIPYRG